MENKVIINLDDYLELREKVKKIDKLKYIISEKYPYNKR